MARVKARNGRNSGRGDLGFEATLWQAADKLRGNLDSGEYKHIVLGLIFLKYISDAFEEKRSALLQDPETDSEDRDEYLAENVFWVPPPARWDYLQSKAKQPDIGKLLDDAMDAIEHDNPRLKGVLPKDYARPALDKRRLGELIDLIGTIGLGDAENRSKDIIGRVYEYFLGQFASAEGRRAASSTRRGRSSAFSSRCWPHARGHGSMTRAAAQAACSSRASTSSRSTAAERGTSRSSARSRTQRPTGYAR